MNKWFILFILLAFSCGPKSMENKKELTLFEVLKTNEYSGSEVRFYEIITESDDFKKLLNDPELKDKVKEKEIFTSNFVLLHMGEKNTGGYRLDVEEVIENEYQIIIKVKDIVPTGMVTTAITYPLTIVKINSKKPIVFQQ